MNINHMPPTEEKFDKAYVDKATRRMVQVIPVPEDLENWYEIDFDPAFTYRGKIYNPETGEWEQYEDTAEEHNKKMLAKRRAAYAETDKLFMEWQYDQTEESRLAWVNAVTKVKEDFPFK